MEEGAVALDNAVALASSSKVTIRRPVLTFLSCVVFAVLLFAAPSTIVSGAATILPAKRVRQASLFSPPPPPRPPPPPPSPPPPPRLSLPPPPPPFSSPPPSETSAAPRSVDAPGAADPGGAKRVPESSPLIQGIIEAGFSREQAREGLAAVNAKSAADNQKVIEWLLKRDMEKNKAEAEAEREVHSYEKMDFDGYALQWGDKHRARTLQECGQKCLEWKPQPPSMYACNIFVFCPLEKCYAPAALPPGSMTGQCWLKHQPDPNRPQVNMKGDYSEAYVKRHMGAPPSVQWQAGVVVKKGSTVDTNVWSSRANW